MAWVESAFAAEVAIFTLLDTSACTWDKRTDDCGSTLSEGAIVFVTDLSEGISDTINTLFLSVNEFSV